MIKVYRGSKIYGTELKKFLESQGTNFMDFNCDEGGLYYGIEGGRISAYFGSELNERYAIEEFNGNLWED